MNSTKYKAGDYVVMKIHGSVYQPGYISRVTGNTYDVNVCILSADKQYLEKLTYCNVDESLLQSAGNK